MNAKVVHKKVIIISSDYKASTKEIIIINKGPKISIKEQTKTKIEIHIIRMAITKGEEIIMGKVKTIAIKINSKIEANTPIIGMIKIKEIKDQIIKIMIKIITGIIANRINLIIM